MIHLKIPEKIYKDIMLDLNRPHKFAYERVGFLFVKAEFENQDTTLILAKDYEPVLDVNYIEDPFVGAKINSSAIRSVMQRILSTGEGALHVHMHGNKGKLGFSKDDVLSIPKLITPFQTVSPNSTHGALLLNEINMISAVWKPYEKQPINVDKISIVQYPMKFYGGIFDERR